MVRERKIGHKRKKTRGGWGERRKNGCEINFKKLMAVYQIWYTLQLAKFDTCYQHYSVVDADKKCDMACEGHPPSSHARFESVLQQALKDFLHVDSLRKEQKDCIK